MRKFIVWVFIIGALIASVLIWYGRHVAAQQDALLNYLQQHTGAQVIDAEGHWEGATYQNTVQLHYPRKHLPTDLYPVLAAYTQQGDSETEEPMLLLLIDQQTQWRTSHVTISLQGPTSVPIFTCELQADWSKEIIGQCQDDSFTLQSADLTKVFRVRDLQGTFRFDANKHWHSTVNLERFELLHQNQPVYRLVDLSLNENLRFFPLTDWIGNTQVAIGQLYTQYEEQPLQINRLNWHVNTELVQDKIQAEFKGELESLEWERDQYGPVAAQLKVSHLDAPAFRTLKTLKKTVLNAESEQVLLEQYGVVNELIARILQNTPQIDLSLSTLTMPAGEASGKVSVNVKPNDITDWTQLYRLPQYLTSHAQGQIDQSLLQVLVKDYYKRDHQRQRVDLGPTIIESMAEQSTADTIADWLENGQITVQDNQYVVDWSIPTGVKE